MTRRLFLMTGLSILLWSSLLSAAEDTRTYVNARFGTCAEIPASFEQVSSSANGDGATFEQSGLAGEIRIYGSFDAMADGLTGYRDFLADMYAQEGTGMTYAPQGDDWFVLSGTTKAGDIVYLRVQAEPDWGPEFFHHIWFEYPAASKTRWDAIVSRSAKSLNGTCREP